MGKANSRLLLSVVAAFLVSCGGAKQQVASGDSSNDQGAEHDVLATANTGIGFRQLCKDGAPPGQSRVVVCASSEKTGLEELRRQLWLVLASAAKDVSIEAEGLADVGFLIDVSRDEIKAALGRPLGCGDRGSRPLLEITDPERGNACDREWRWYYNFYYLPLLSKGGGPVLIIEFGKDERCVRAEFLGLE